MIYKTSAIWWPILLLVDGLGYLLFGWKLLFVKGIKHDEIKKILVIRLDNIGDVLVTTPALRALRKRFPNARIDVLLKPYTKDVLIGNKSVDRIWTIEPVWLHRSGALNLWKSFIFFFGKNNTLQKLKNENYDLAIEFHTDPRNILLMFLIGAKQRIGHAARGFGFLLTKIVPFNDEQHIIERHLDIPRFLGCDVKDKRTELVIKKEDEQRIKKLLIKDRLVGKKLVCINPGTGRPNKYWLNERWASLADKLIEKYNATIVFTGSGEDLKDINEIAGKMGNKTYKIFAGKLKLIESAALIKNCKLFISTDTGPMHIAKAVGTPLIGLFGPVNPEHWGYKDEKSSYVSGFEQCSCKYLPDCRRKEDKYLCMKSIEVEDVIKEVEKLL